ncbi:MAG: hypothetical protein ACRDDX_01330 [Cellulosilyticaceae bacterium]
MSILVVLLIGTSTLVYANPKKVGQQEMSLSMQSDNLEQAQQLPITFKQDNLTYKLSEIRRVNGTQKFISTYKLQQFITRTYTSWESCRNSPAEIIEDNTTYYLIKSERIHDTQKFLATYEIKKEIYYEK